MAAITPADFTDLVHVASPISLTGSDDVCYLTKRMADSTSYTTTVHRTDASGDSREIEISTPDPIEAVAAAPTADKLVVVGSDDDESADLWVLDPETAETTRLSNVVGGVEAVVWNPSGTALAFVQRVSETEQALGVDLNREADPSYERTEPDPREIDRIPYRGRRTFLDGRRHHVYVVDLAAGDIVRLTSADREHVSPTWLDDETLCYASKEIDDGPASNRFDIVSHRLDDGATASLATTTDWDPLSGAVPELHGTATGGLVFSRKAPTQTSISKADLVYLDLETGREECITENVDRTLDRATGVTLSPARDTVYFWTPDAGSFELFRYAIDDEAPVSLYHSDGGHVTGYDVSAESVAFTESRWDDPGNVFSLDIEDGSVAQHSAVNEAFLAERSVAEPEECWFTSEDGTEVQGWVLRPPEFDPGASYPGVVEIHGGPHAMWTTSGSMWHEFQCLASAGFVVFWCNPRGSRGYGPAFESATASGWGGIDAADVDAGARQLAEHPFVDTDNLFVTGGSYGGYMTAWLSTTTDRFRAASVQRGVYDLWTFYLTSIVSEYVEYEFGEDALEQPEFLLERSPTTHASDCDTPTLIIHAEEDYGVPISQAEMYFQALQKADVPSRLVRYPREGHDLSRTGEPGHLIDRLERILAWFEGYSEHHETDPPLPDETVPSLSEN